MYGNHLVAAQVMVLCLDCTQRGVAEGEGAVETSLAGTTRPTSSETAHLDKVKAMVLGRMRDIGKRERGRQHVTGVDIAPEEQETQLVMAADTELVESARVIASMLDIGWAAPGKRLDGTEQAALETQHGDIGRAELARLHDGTE